MERRGVHGRGDPEPGPKRAARIADRNGGGHADISADERTVHLRHVYRRARGGEGKRARRRC